MQTHLDLNKGQQCMRDFFICLNENFEQWPDLYTKISFCLNHSITCSVCGEKSEYKTDQSYIEMDVPPDGSNMKYFIEDTFNGFTSVEAMCTGSCNQSRIKQKRTELVPSILSNFIIVILSRGQITVNGYQFVGNRVTVTDDVNVRYL